MKQPRKIAIVINDIDADTGKIEVTNTFDPELDTSNKDEEPTAGVLVALRMMEVLSNSTKGSDGAQ